MAAEMLPPFQEAACCAVCSTPFSTFRRRHHCRCCGRSLCSDHSSSQLTLPQFGISAPVRVCNECYEAVGKNSEPAKTSGFEAVASSVSRLSLKSENNFTDGGGSFVTSNDNHAFSCTCGMPLCICQPPVTQEIAQPTEAVVPILESAAPVRSKRSSSSSPNVSSSKPSTSCHGTNLPSLFFANGSLPIQCNNPTSKNYEFTGEAMREAIKNGDIEAVKHLLQNGVDPNYCDKQGMSLLHLAAVFNLTDITFLLMEAGAKVDAKNWQGETPLDCAQVTLQYKMRQKIKAMSGN